jgi:hypothetical protein
VEILLRKFPMFFRFSQAGEQSPALFVFGYMEPEFQNNGSVASQVKLVISDRVISFLPYSCPDGPGEFLSPEVFGMNAYH